MVVKIFYSSYLFTSNNWHFNWKIIISLTKTQRLFELLVDHQWWELFFILGAQVCNYEDKR